MKHPIYAQQTMKMEATLRSHDVNRLIEGLFAIERELRTLLDARLATHSLTYAQFSVLRFIGEPFNPAGKPLGREPTSTEVAEHFGFAKRTVTVTVNALSEKGWVERRHCKDDRRARILRVTPTGKLKLANALIAYSPINQIFHYPSRQKELAIANEIPLLLNKIRQLQRLDGVRNRKALRAEP